MYIHVIRDEYAAGATHRPLAEQHHAARLFGGASQPDQTEAQCWVCYSSRNFGICNRGCFTEYSGSRVGRCTMYKMQLRYAKIRATAANKVALGAEQSKGCRWKEVQDLNHEVSVKKARTEASTIGLCQLQGMGPTWCALSVDNDNEFKSRREWIRRKSRFYWLKGTIFFKKSRGGKMIWKQMTIPLEVRLCHETLSQEVTNFYCYRIRSSPCGKRWTT